MAPLPRPTPRPRRTRERLSGDEARRLALTAQGFGDPRPDRLPGPRELSAVVGRVGLLQIDSVNALCRSHYLPLFSRLGAYPFALLERAAFEPGRGRAGGRRTLFEYWGHEASLLPVAMFPLFRWRMARAARGEGIYGSLRRIATEQPALVERVFAEVAARGPTRAGELAHLDPVTPAERRAAAGAGGAAGGGWWGWGDVKRAVEFLFWSGRLTAAGRAGNFERLYAVPEIVLPATVLAAPVPAEDAAQRALLLVAARALGVATEGDLRDYFRLDVADARARLGELVAAGELRPVQVEGWRVPGFLHPAARVPRGPVGARALLSPFDSLVWERARTERLFHGFRYRLEIYTPAARRVHGYYVLPFLLGERLAARVDLRADRAGGVLRVPGAHAEMDVAPETIAGPLAEELRALAAWLGLERVRVEPGAAGALAGRLRREF